jgi:hypothetical protein
MSVFSPGVENRLTALAASFMVRKANALEAFSRLTALDVLFADSAGGVLTMCISHCYKGIKIKIV